MNPPKPPVDSASGTSLPAHRLADLSHALRTPLWAIQSWTELLSRALEPAAPEVERALHGIRVGIAQQLRLLDAMSDGDASAGEQHTPR